MQEKQINAAHLVFVHQHGSSQIVECYALQNNIPANVYASNSVLVSLATHVTYRFPFLNIFGKLHKSPQIKPQKNQVNSYLTFHPFLELWCDKLCETVFKGHAIRKDKVLYFALELQKQQFDELLKQKEKLIRFELKSDQNCIQKVLMRVSGYEKLPIINSKIIYMNVSNSQLRTDPFVPIISARSILLGLLYNNEVWINFDILKGQIPGIELLKDCEAVIIPGSTNSILSYVPEVEKMSENLFKAFQINKKLKILGICYGHQLIALKNKGKVVKKKRTDKLEKIQLHEQQIKNLRNKFTFLNKIIDNQKETILLQHHEDYVQNIPEEFHVLGSSKSCLIQCLLHKSGRMLSFQSHPEYILQYSKAFVERIIKYRSGKIQNNKETEIDKKEQKLMKNHHQSCERIMALFYQFLRWDAELNQVRLK